MNEIPVIQNFFLSKRELCLYRFGVFRLLSAEQFSIHGPASPADGRGSRASSVSISGGVGRPQGFC